MVMRTHHPTAYEIACQLVSFYDLPFGGKPSGRFRISPKNLRNLANRRRISDDLVKQLTEVLFEMEYVFVDMETFYAMTSARTFTNYRRVADSMVGQQDN